MTAFPRNPLRLSRRRFVRTLAGAAGFAGLSGIGLNGIPGVLAASPYPFEEVPPSASRIAWTHTAGKSAEKYLPETTGAGCAFLDYDNDGWMDIYLVNSGKCDFYNPAQPLRNRYLSSRSSKVKASRQPECSEGRCIAGWSMPPRSENEKAGAGSLGLFSFTVGYRDQNS